MKAPINPIPTSWKEEWQRRVSLADKEVFDAMVECAEAYLEEIKDKTLHTVEKFANEINEKVEDVKDAWDVAIKNDTNRIAKEMADKIRKLKDKPFIFKDSNGNEIDYSKF